MTVKNKKCPVRDKILVEMRIPPQPKSRRDAILVETIRDEIHGENIMSLTGQGERVAYFSTNIMSLTGQDRHYLQQKKSA